MIRFCVNPKCGRGFADTKPERKGVTPPTMCPTCRHGREPLETRVGGHQREEAAHGPQPSPPPSLEDQA